MPINSRLSRTLVVLSLAAVAVISAMPAPAAGLEPPRPLPRYHPEFVTQLGAASVNDCLWASASMMLDKWTNGRKQVSHQRLRRLSGDLRGGSNLIDLQRAYKRLGFNLRYSPDGGERIGWSQLLRRLSNGAGAVILGDYGDLPYWWGRWDYGFWKAKDKKDNHAFYIERYDRKRDRVWLMDPLAPADWKGEWIPVWALRRFAWSSGGALYVATTPTAKPAPFAGVRIGNPAETVSADSLDVAWRLRAPSKWRFQGADVKAEFSRAGDPLRAAAEAPPPPVRAPRGGADGAPAKPTASVAGDTLRATAALPTKPGAYVATLTVKDRRFGAEVASSDAATVFVAGPRRATLRLDARDGRVEAGERLEVWLSVANTGDETWAEPPAPLGAMPESTAARSTRVVARWISLDVAPGDEAAPKPVILDEVPLAPGRRAELTADLRVPEAEGRWALAIDVVDDVDGSFAAGGSAPAILVVEVVTPRGIDATQ